MGAIGEGEIGDVAIGAPSPRVAVGIFGGHWNILLRAVKTDQ
jgi:hypothetical protein